MHQVTSTKRGMVPQPASQSVGRLDGLSTREMTTRDVSATSLVKEKPVAHRQIKLTKAMKTTMTIEKRKRKSRKKKNKRSQRTKKTKNKRKKSKRKKRTTNKMEKKTKTMTRKVNKKTLSQSQLKTRRSRSKPSTTTHTIAKTRSQEQCSRWTDRWTTSRIS